MNLSVILDIAIGLIFIYLILSLLASEVQELLSTILQWRATHLKKSIEILLAGGTQTPEEERAIELANRLYNNPLIKNINQEAKGFFVSLPRQFTWLISSIYRSGRNLLPANRRNRGMFGEKKRSGPSYIDSQTFATTLLETLKVPTVIHRIITSKLKEFKDERLIKELQEILDEFRNNINSNKTENAELSESNSNDKSASYREIEQAFESLKKQIEKIIREFEDGKATLTNSLDRIEEKLDIYITKIQENLDLKNEKFCQVFERRINFLKADIFGINANSKQTEKIALLGEMKPSLREIIQNYRENYNIYVKTKNEIEEAVRTKSPIASEIEQTYQSLENLFGKIESDRHILPSSVFDSLEVLAIRAQAKVKSTEDDLNQLRQEIEIWFDRAMERTSGVYKRNSKGVALMLGLLIAVATNADTFYIIDRLSKDSTIRTAVAEGASKAAIDPSEIATVRTEVEKALNGISLPIGWNLDNSNTQSNQSETKPDRNLFLVKVKKFGGWLLSGMAIAMGAPFWFDLLNRIVNVRNAGRPPKSSVNSETVSDK